MTTLQHWTVAAALCAYGGGATASAQNAAKPYPAIFGGAAVPDPAKTSTVDVSLQAYDAYDDNLEADVAGSPTSAIAASGYYTVLEPSVTLDTRTGGVHIGARANSNVRYYGDLQQVIVTGEEAAIGVNAELSRHTSLFVNQGVTYTPSYLHGLFAPAAAVAPGTAVDSASDYGSNDGYSVLYATTARLTREVRPRLELSADLGYRKSDFIGTAPGYFDLFGYDTGGTMRYSLTKNLRLRLGYIYRFTEYSPQYRPTENDIEIGFEYTMVHSSLRRTMFAFSLGPAIANGTTTGGSVSGNDRQYRIAGDFSLNHQFSRTWTLQGMMRRGLGYIENVPRPVLSNAASAQVQGFLNRRTDLAVSAGYTSGELAITGTPPPFSTYTGEARLRFA
ncbi:MAG: hypothetical protein ACRD3J_16405, partial [Thermoanaerobaculia bacterium]